MEHKEGGFCESPKSCKDFSGKNCWRRKQKLNLKQIKTINNKFQSTWSNYYYNCYDI